MGVSGEPLLKNTPSSDENRVRFNEIGSDVLRWIFGNDWIKESISARILMNENEKKNKEKNSSHIVHAIYTHTYIYIYIHSGPISLYALWMCA